MKIKKFQEGGAAPAPEQGMAPGAEQGGAGAEEQIAQMAQAIIQQVGPEGAALLAQVIMQMLQGGGQPQEGQQPTFQRKGGKLVQISK